MKRIKRIIAGGQTGTDRAAMDFARKHDIPLSGYCPGGGWAEDHPDPPGIRALYPELTETEETDPAVRTVRNVLDSDTVIAVCPGLSGGTRLAVGTAKEAGIPCVIADGGTDTNSLKEEDIYDKVLNIAGPRMSECERAYEFTMELLEELFYGN